MDPLKRLIELLSAQGVVAHRKMYDYLAKEAERKFKEATLINEANGSSQAEKVTLAQGSKDWLVFHQELAKLEARYKLEMFKLKVLELEFQATYLSQKQDGKDIQRGAES